MKERLELNIGKFYSESGLDVKHCFVLDDIINWCTNISSERIEDNRLIIDGKIWTWINFQQLQYNLPYCEILSHTTMNKIIKNLVNKGYIIIKRGTGFKTYFQITKKTMDLKYYKRKKS
jgi:hypothetical protein